eukprot:UN23478
MQIKDFNALREKPFLDRGVRKVIQPGDEVIMITFADIKKHQKTIENKWSWDNVNIVWNTGRCGSTLMHKVLDSLPTMHSFTEPQYFDEISFRYKKEADYFPLLFGLDIYFAKERNPKLEYFSLNPKGISTMLPWVEKNLPSVKSVFMYRKISEIVESFNSIFYKGGISKVLTGGKFRTPDFFT